MKVEDVIYNYLVVLLTMIQHFESMIQEMSQLPQRKHDIQIYRFSETPYFNNILHNFLMIQIVATNSCSTVS